MLPLHKADVVAHACYSNNRKVGERGSGAEGHPLLYKSRGYPGLCNIMPQDIKDNGLMNW